MDKKESRSEYMKKYREMKKKEKIDDLLKNNILTNLETKSDDFDIFSNVGKEVSVESDRFRSVSSAETSIFLERNKDAFITTIDGIKRDKPFQVWLNNHRLTMREFREKVVIYNEYHETIRANYFIFSVFEKEITLPFMKWFLLYELVMEEFVENQL